MRAPDQSWRFLGLPEDMRTWAIELEAACRCWHDWRLAPTGVLYSAAAGWNALPGTGICELVLTLSDHEIEWSTKASDMWEVMHRARRRTSTPPIDAMND